MNKEPMKTTRWGWLVLFTTSTTLVCCVIPIVLVSLGLGAVVASVYGNLPFLAFLGLNKGWVFFVTGLILGLAAWALFRPGRSCPANPELNKMCRKADRWNRGLFFGSVLIWLGSFFAAYALLPLTIYIDNLQ